MTRRSVATGPGLTAATRTPSRTLIAEVETSAAAAEEAAADARARALDPTVLDPSARTAAADAEFTRDRLRAALPKLRTRLGDLQKAEAYTRWVADYDRVKPLRDALAEELRALYPEFEARLTDLLRRVQQADAEISRVSYAKPIDAPNDGRCLRTVELEARGIEGFGFNGLSILRDLKLPSWELGSALAWPPPGPNTMASSSLLARPRDTRAIW